MVEFIFFRGPSYTIWTRFSWPIIRISYAPALQNIYAEFSSFWNSIFLHLHKCITPFFCKECFASLFRIWYAIHFYRFIVSPTNSVCYLILRTCVTNYKSFFKEIQKIRNLKPRDKLPFTYHLGHCHNILFRLNDKPMLHRIDQ